MNEKYTVLFVDDERNILSAVQRQFHDAPFTVITAPAAKDALEILREAKVDVVVSDLKMPEMDGYEFLKRVRVEWPDIVRIALTGDDSLAAVKAAMSSGEVFRFLKKPWRVGEFNTVMDQALRERALVLRNMGNGNHHRPLFTLNTLEQLKNKLVTEGLIRQQELDTALEVARSTEDGLGSILLRMNYISEERLLDFLARNLNFPRVRLADLRFDSEPRSILPEDIARRYQILPLKRKGKRIAVAIADALNLMVADEIQALYDIEIEPNLCSEADIQDALDALYGEEGRDSEPILGPIGAGSQDAGRETS